MKTPVKRIREVALYRAIVILPAILAGIAGCATTATHQAAEVHVRTIWESREQYVAIEKQGTTTVNAHPVDVSAERLRDALESIEVRLPGSDKAVSLFDGPGLKILSEKIHEGLASAGPGEDVTFAVIGQYPALLGLLHERKVTVGRVFCQDGQLNIIFGDVLRDVKEGEDRRLYPFRTASRTVVAAGNRALSGKPGGENFTTKRVDWLTFPPCGPSSSGHRTIGSDP